MMVITSCFAFSFIRSINAMMIDSFLNIGFHTYFYYIAAKYWIQDYIPQFFALFSVPLVKLKTMIKI